MSFIGIIVKKKKEKERAKLEQMVYPNQILFLKEEDLEHLKNIRFETIVLQDETQNKEALKNLLAHCKYIVINSDTGMENDIEPKEEQAVITYGYHFKDTVTFSSVTDQEAFVCLQRKIRKPNRGMDGTTRNFAFS